MRRVSKPFGFAPALVGLILAGACGFATSASAAEDWFRPAGAPGPETAPAQAGGQDYGQPVTPPAAPPQMAPNNQRQSDFPSDQVHDWVVASARAARSRALLHLAEKQLNDSIRDLQFAFEQSHEYHDAAAAEKQAYEAYTVERQKALKSVLNDPKYVTAIELRDDMADKIAKVRAMSRPGPIPREDLLAMASQKLQYASDAHDMEREALEKDAAVQEARDKMVRASARASELRGQFDASIRMNPQVAQARRNLDQARVELITAEAYASAAAAAGEVATDYTFYRHRWDGLSSAPGYGYGYGPYANMAGQ